LNNLLGIKGKHSSSFKPCKETASEQERSAHFINSKKSKSQSQSPRELLRTGITKFTNPKKETDSMQSIKIMRQQEVLLGINQKVK
jgi:hypothetical protein